MAQVEAILSNPASSHEDFVIANGIAASINEMDKDNPDCQDGGNEGDVGGDEDNGDGGNGNNEGGNGKAKGKK